MEIKQLYPGGFDVFPQVFVMPIELTGDHSSNGDVSQHLMESTTLSPDAKIRTAIYSLRHNRCVVSVESQQGAIVQDFRFRVNVGFSEFKGKKTLHVTVIDTPHTEGKTHKYLTFKLANGTTRMVRNQKFITGVSTCLETWLQSHLNAPNSWNLEKIQDDNTRKYVDPSDLAPYYDDTYKRRATAARICASLFSSVPKKLLTLQELLDGHFITEYPQIDIPYKVLKKFDTKIHYQFIGMMLKGGYGGHIMNLQTAQRISRILGEPVSVGDILSQLDHLSSVLLGSMRLWALGIAIKQTKRLS